MRTNRIAAAVAIMLLVLLFPASGWAAHSFALGTAHGPALNTNKLAGAPAAVIGGRARLIVHVMGSRGGPVAGARVLVRHPRRHSPQFHLRTGGNGVTGASVGNGRWVIRARRPGEGRGRATVVTHSGGVVQVSITLHGARNSFHPHQQHLLGTHLPTLTRLPSIDAKIHPKATVGSGGKPAGVPTAPPKAAPPAHKAPHAVNEPAH